MREVSVKVYSYDELSERAKEKALQEFQSWGDYPWTEENRQTLKAFEELFPIKVTNWEYGYHNHISFRFTEDEDIESLSGVRLAKYINNNYSIFENNKGCPLTGYCVDEDILDPIYKFLKRPEKHVTFNDLMNDCLHAWIYACNRDMEYYYSEESFRETCEANEWEFTEDGKLYR